MGGCAGKVVANFSASWCGPCRVIAPVYAEMSKTYPQLMFLTIDVDDLMDFSSSWDIRATPTFFFLKNGQQIDKLAGANKPELEKKVLAAAGYLSVKENNSACKLFTHHYAAHLSNTDLYTGGDTEALIEGINTVMKIAADLVKKKQKQKAGGLLAIEGEGNEDKTDA